MIFLMHRAGNNAVTVVVVLALCLGQTGCVTAKKYKLAKADAPPVRPLGWTVAAPPAELTLETLIVYKGPGTWKREAKWDEYVVKFTNHGTVPLTIGMVALIDILSQPQVPGVDPWKLEKISSTNWDKYGSTGLQLLAGAGLAVVYVGIGVGVALGGFMGGSAAATGGAAFALTAIPIFAVVDLSAVAVINHNNKAKVRAEFDRRRLVLPQTVASGASATGSFFFPMTPGPQRLIVKGQAGDSPLELTLELKQLSGLHLKPAEKK